MEGKLKSILRPIPWSLAVKAAALGAAWYFLPFWVFAILALYFYFVPLFHSALFLAPFVIILGVAAMGAASFWLAVFLAVIFYLLLGIKNLIFVDRGPLYEVMALLILFLAYFIFFAGVSGWVRGALIFSIIPAAAFFFLFKDMLEFGGTEKKTENFLVLGVSTLVVWQFSLALLFLPLDFVYPTSLMFLFLAVLMEIVPDYLRGMPVRRKVLALLTVFFVFAAIILGSATWRI